MRTRLVALSLATIAAIGSLTACSTTPNAIDTLKKAGYADAQPASFTTRSGAVGAGKDNGPGGYRVFLNSTDRGCAGYVEFRADGTYVDATSGIVGATPEQMRDGDKLLEGCTIAKP